MSQADIHPTKPANPLPGNPFADSDPCTTIQKCSQVCAFLSDAIPGAEFGGMTMGENEANGVAWILDGVKEALNHALSASQGVNHDR